MAMASDTILYGKCSAYDLSQPLYFGLLLGNFAPSMNVIKTIPIIWTSEAAIYPIQTSPFTAVGPIPNLAVPLANRSHRCLVVTHDFSPSGWQLAGRSDDNQGRTADCHSHTCSRPVRSGIVRPVARSTNGITCCSWVWRSKSPF